MSHEKIYTIRINEALKEAQGCPLCAVERRVEQDELERILGAAMMEPSVREQTNEMGFCSSHLKRLLVGGNRLSMALVVHTHLQQLARDLYVKSTPLLSKTPDLKKQASLLDKALHTCYICSRVGGFMNSTIETFIFLYKSDAQFKEKMKSQPYYCTKHTYHLVREATRSLPKQMHSDFSKAINDLNLKYTTTLISDLEWFCKKSDYRYKNEDWKNSKDAIERTVELLKS